VETGASTSATTPSPVGRNLKAITWNTANPLLTIPLLVGPLAEDIIIGFNIARSIADVYSVDALLYDTWTAGDPLSKPATANFLVRLRFLQWDTEDNVQEAKGSIFASVTEAKVSIH
jgi:hypothetical protein